MYPSTACLAKDTEKRSPPDCSEPEGDSTQKRVLKLEPGVEPELVAHIPHISEACPVGGPEAHAILHPGASELHRADYAVGVVEDSRIRCVQIDALDGFPSVRIAELRRYACVHKSAEGTVIELRLDAYRHASERIVKARVLEGVYAVGLLRYSRRT